MKTCTKCKASKLIGDFAFKNKPKNQRRNICKTCSRALSREHYRKNKSKYKHNKKQHIEKTRVFLRRFLANNPCVDCGESDSVVLQLDHMENKTDHVSTGVGSQGWSIAKLEEELTRCVVRCANCHQRKTAKEQGWYFLSKEFTF